MRVVTVSGYKRLDFRPKGMPVYSGLKENLKEAVALVELYERYGRVSVIRHELSQLEDYDSLPNALTYITTRRVGTGYRSGCLLCRAVNDECENCIHSALVFRSDRMPLELTGFSPCVYHQTYMRVVKAETVDELARAFRMRAKFIRELVARYCDANGIDNPLNIQDDE